MKRSALRALCLALPLLLAALILAGCLPQMGEEPVSSQPRPLPGPAPSALPEDDELGYRFLCTLPNMNSYTNTYLARGVQDRCDELGIEVVMHNSHDDHMSQAYQMDAFVSGGGQAVLCIPVDTEALQPFLAHARSQGLWLLEFGEVAQADAGITYSMHVAGDLLAQDAAAFIAEELEGAGSVAVLKPLETTPLETSFYAGLQAGLQQALPGESIFWHEMETGETGGDALLAVLEENPEVNVILGANDSTVLVAMQTLEYHLGQLREAEDDAEEEIDLSRYYFGAAGGSEEAMQALREDNPFRATITLNAYECGVRMVDMAAGLLQGEAGVFEEATPQVVDKANAEGYNYLS